MTLSPLRTGHLRRRGFSVLELLIATTIAMVILLVVTKWFRDLSQQTSRSRALVEMSGQLRSVIAQLEADMRGATFPRGATPGTVAPMGYIQYVEGIASDSIPAWPVTTMQMVNPSPPPATIAAGTTLPFPTLQYRTTSGLLSAGPNNTPPTLGYSANILGAPNPAIDQFNSRFGDLDDVLSLTTRNLENPFRGTILLRTSADDQPPAVAIQSIESPMAEVVWWVEGLDENADTVISDAERQVRRRIFLIRPDLTDAINKTWRTLINPAGGNPRGFGLNIADALQIMREQCDISFTIEGASGNALANSLADLAAPSNQAANITAASAPCRRITLGTPNRVLLNSLAFPKTPNAAGDAVGITRSRYGEDVMISSVAAFDIRIYDDMAPLWQGSGVTLSPGDPQYLTSAGTTKVGQGAFVDLNYALIRDPSQHGVGASLFSGPPSEFSGFFRVPIPTVANAQYSQLFTAFDTWAPAANNSIDGVDSTTNGAAGVIDDVDELMAELPTAGAAGQFVAPPYGFPLRALQVTLRTYDPDSRQIRQLKASAAFTND
jgi:hypothetical protein